MIDQVQNKIDSKGMNILDSIFVPSLTSTIKCLIKNERFLLTWSFIKLSSQVSKIFKTFWTAGQENPGQRGSHRLS